MPSNHARNIALTPQLDQFVSDLIEGGCYSSASEVVRDGLRELKRRVIADQIIEIRARVVAGLDQLDRGEGITGTPAEVLGSRLKTIKRNAVQ